jgi:pectinesterase
MLNRFYSLLLLCFSLTAIAQQAGVQRDTSFTVYSAFEKAKKEYPLISIARPAVPGNITSKYNIVYCAYGERQLSLDIFYPKKKKAKKYPAVLLIHGGGWRSGDRSQHIPLAQQIAAQGYVTVTVEYRLSTEALYPASVYDVKAALRWMRANAQKYGTDTTKIAVLGFSSGGQMAALTGTTNGEKKFEGGSCFTSHSSNVQAIIDIDGILAFIHPESAEGDDRKSTSAATYWFGASKTQKPELWQEASALNHVSSTTPPVLFINSSLPRFHAGRDDLIKKLDSLHIYSEVHTLPDTPHPFLLFNPWFEPTVNFIVKFLNKVFKNE